MNYDEYVKMQVDGEIIKPMRYHIGEYFAMAWFFSDYENENRNQSILDVGCGIGYGTWMLKNVFDFKYALGIDLNLEKIKLGRHFGYNIHKIDVIDLPGDILYDAVWCSHTFEHMLDPDKALKRLMECTTKDANFYFVLPYPDLMPSPVHHAAPIIGTNINDDAETLEKWFIDRGLVRKFRAYDDFREKEIWFEFKKA